MNSRQKGARGEREWRDVLRSHGHEARRGCQFSGSPDSPDVVCDLPFHFEVKRVQKLNIYDAVSQAKADCGDKHPVVAHRRNGGEWLVTMPSGVFFSLIGSQCNHVWEELPDGSRICFECDKRESPTGEEKENKNQ